MDDCWPWHCALRDAQGHRRRPVGLPALDQLASKGQDGEAKVSTPLRTVITLADL